MVSFPGDPVLGEVADGSGVGLLSVDEEVIFSCVYDNRKTILSNYRNVKSTNRNRITLHSN